MARGRHVQHFTQLIWADATRVGCAVGKLKTTKGRRNIRDVWLCCNYDTGNMLTQPIYEVGAPASHCKSGIKSSKYRGLCDTASEENEVISSSQNTVTIVRSGVTSVVKDFSSEVKDITSQVSDFADDLGAEDLPIKTNLHRRFISIL